MIKQRCPCHSGQPYEACCQPLHLGLPAPTAERLMRSRYSAYALKNKDYLQSSWHASTRPDNLTEENLQGIKWLSLEIIDTKSQDAHNATVTYKAKFRTLGKKTQTLHEKSHFLLENGFWFYVNGEMLTGE